LRVCVPIFFFFFSSRRRHTRFSRDWSSDVCSSDLALPAARGAGGDGFGRVVGVGLVAAGLGGPGRLQRGGLGRGDGVAAGVLDGPDEGPLGGEIGRASCRERGEGAVGAGGQQEGGDG